MYRRTFLTTAAAAPAVAALQAQSPQPRPGRPMQIHLSCGSIGVKADQRQAIEYAAQFGYDAVDADAAYLGKLSDAELKQLLDDMRSKRVVWAIGGLPVEFRRDEEQFQAGMKILPERAQALQRAGVTRVTTWVLPSHATRTYLENFQLHARRLRAAANVLADHNLRFGLEYVGPRTALNSNKYPFVHTLAEMRELIAEIKHPNVGLVLDSWHWYTAQDTAQDLLQLKAADIVSVDLNDAPAGIPVDQQRDIARELPAATGVIDVRTFLTCLKKTGYTGPVRAEPFNEALRRMAPDDALRATLAAIEKAFATIPA
jgi:sugar phosphate isomerase/epimerase